MRRFTADERGDERVLRVSVDDRQDGPAGRPLDDPAGRPGDDPEGGAKGERRLASDRRAKPTPMFSRFTFRGRRRWVRRDAERRGSYVDRPGPWMFGMMAIVLALSILDAVFTLAHLERGGEEVNPLMAQAIELGPATFLAIKCFLTGSGMLLLVLHRFFTGVRIMLISVLGAYVLLMLYHLWLVTI